jgi:hypothetical protein
VSTVVPRLAEPVTSFQHSFFVSDQGTAAIWGHDACAQAGQIITQVAHPSARDELREAGRELGFVVLPPTIAPDRPLLLVLGRPAGDFWPRAIGLPSRRPVTLRGDDGGGRAAGWLT